MDVGAEWTVTWVAATMVGVAFLLSGLIELGPVVI